MGSSSIPSPADISAEAFAGFLGRYPDVIAAVSEAKGAKPGQKSLAELDEFRYSTAPAMFGAAGGRAMVQDDVLTLVAWKLRHGKFRPTLMKLVESNSPAVVKKTVEDAGKAYRDAVGRKGQTGPKKLAGHPEAALSAVKILCNLKGIGPATASLLVAVHFPNEAIFFSDEVYAWLCGGASHSPPSKYNAKEYEDVARDMVKLLNRLPEQYGAQDVEQVAYVVMYDKKNGSTAVKVETTTKTTKAADTMEAAPVEARAEDVLEPLQGIDTKRRKQPSQSLYTRKRKQPPTDAAPAASGTARRSSRLQRS